MDDDVFCEERKIVVVVENSLVNESENESENENESTRGTFFKK